MFGEIIYSIIIGLFWKKCRISSQTGTDSNKLPEAVDMNGRFHMQGGKNWFLPKEMNANRFLWDSHWLEFWSNHFYPSMGPNGGSVAMDSGGRLGGKLSQLGGPC
jgi:hypothetical protein